MTDRSRCTRCGFDPSQWDERDTANTMRQLSDFVALSIEGLPEELLTRTRSPQSPSIAELLDELPPEDERHASDRPVEVLHDHFHRLVDVADIRHELGDSVELTGSVNQISRSDGGVPKLAVPSATIERRGVVGDTQAARQHHGRPWQALCLYSTECIEALNAEGHSLQPGSLGENLTLSGIDWAELRTGLTLRVGSMVGRISAPAVPCSKNARWFADGRFARVGHDVHPGWSRWYATVLTPGRVSAGDRVTIDSQPLESAGDHRSPNVAD